MLKHLLMFPMFILACALSPGILINWMFIGVCAVAWVSSIDTLLMLGSPMAPLMRILGLLLLVTFAAETYITRLTFLRYNRMAKPLYAATVVSPLVIGSGLAITGHWGFLVCAIPLVAMSLLPFESTCGVALYLIPCAHGFQLAESWSGYWLWGIAGAGAMLVVLQVIQNIAIPEKAYPVLDRGLFFIVDWRLDSSPL